MRVGEGLLDKVFWNAYNRYWGQTDQGDVVRSRVENVLGRLNEQGAMPTQKVLDAGCGTGVYTLALGQAGFVATGVDVSGSLLAQAGRSATALKVPATFEKMDLDDVLWYDDGSFDHAICAAVMHWVRQPANLLAELRRVITPGGLLVTTLWLDPIRHREAYPQAFAAQRAGLRQTALKRVKDLGERSRYARYWNTDEIAQLLKVARFEPLSLDGTPVITAVARAR